MWLDTESKRVKQGEKVWELCLKNNWKRQRKSQLIFVWQKLYSTVFFFEGKERKSRSWFVYFFFSQVKLQVEIWDKDNIII